MRQSIFQRLFLSGFALAFALLLISGAPRLIASSDVYKNDEIRVRPVQAYLCNPVAQEHAQTSQHPESRHESHAAFIAFHAEPDAPGASMLSADANGNVISCASYMRSVYQVFALGDGFA